MLDEDEGEGNIRRTTIIILPRRVHVNGKLEAGAGMKTVKLNINLIQEM